MECVKRREKQGGEEYGVEVGVRRDETCRNGVVWYGSS